MVQCSQCGSKLLYRDGIRYLSDGSTVQRWLCRNCGYRFSENGKSYNHLFTNIGNGKYAVKLQQSRAKSPLKAIVLTETIGKTAEATGDAQQQQQDIKGKLIQFIWNMQKDNYAKSSITLYSQALTRLQKAGADLFNPETVKETLAKLNVSENRKHNIAAAYTLFLSMNGLTWKPPKEHIIRKLPFIPTEREIDDLIAGCGKKTAAYLQTLKETAMRMGEAAKIKWEDIDLERKIIVLNDPEKNGNPRIFNISNKLVNMLAALPKKNGSVWGTESKITRGSVFYRERRKVSHKLANPRLLRIGFHTLRHWKATMLYHETKNPVLVKEFLGHKTLDTTLLYIQTEKALFKEENDSFEVKAVKDHEDIKALLEVGFEYICEKDGLMFFRKRK